MTRSRIARALWIVTVSALALEANGCRRRAASGRSATTRASSSAPINGQYWARIADVPDGMRVRLSLESDGTRVRGSYSAQPWDGELDGTVLRDGSLSLRLFERGVTQAIGARDREVTLRRDGLRYIGADREGHTVELVRAPMGTSTLAPGVWLARWTGLPFGMAAETRLTRDPDGRWRGVYQYQSGGGTRDGSFQGTVSNDGTLELEWTETNDGTTVARGRASLHPSRLGLRGTYGIEGHSEGIGEWIFEPLALD
ncbi:MAG: hypothetical protein U0269_21985 [Polyangiales bacterium]